MPGVIVICNSSCISNDYMLEVIVIAISNSVSNRM